MREFSRLDDLGHSLPIMHDDVQRVLRYRDSFPEDGDRMAWALAHAVSHGLTKEFSVLLAEGLTEERRVDWGPIFNMRTPRRSPH